MVHASLDNVLSRVKIAEPQTYLPTQFQDVGTKDRTFI